MNTQVEEPKEDKPLSQHEIRKLSGECWMMCSECGSKLWSFDGVADASRPCPYKRGGKCDPR